MHLTLVKIMRSKKTSPLNIREKYLRDKFTASEKIYFSAIFSIFIALIFNIDNRSIWTSCFIIVIGSILLINLRIHELVHPFVVEKIWEKVLYLNSPVILLIIIYLLTALGNPIKYTTLNEIQFLEFLKPDNIFSANVAFKDNWILFLSTCSLFLISSQFLLIPKSLHFINLFISLCCKSLFVVILIAYVYKAANLEKALYSYGTGQSDFFFYFPYDGAWAAFALIWMYASFAISIEYKNKDSKIEKNKAPTYLVLCVLLGSTTLFIKESVSSLFLSFAFAHICFKTLNHFERDKKPLLKVFLTCFWLLGIGSFIKGLVTYVKIFEYNTVIENLKKSSIEMIADSPLFGWGINGFHMLAPYYNDASLINHKYEAIPSSLLSFLCEFGLIGTIIIWVYSIIFYVYYLKNNLQNSFSNTLFFALFLTVLLSFFDNIFYSIPVAFSFSLIGFIAMRWGQLFHNYADEVDSPKGTKTSSHMRRTPYTMNPKRDAIK